MRIVSGPSIDGTARTRRGANEPGASAPPESARALIPLEAVRASERQVPMSRYPAAAFLAHLIATQMRAPQTRARRRSEPADAIAAYAAARAPRRKMERASGRRMLDVNS